MIASAVIGLGAGLLFGLLGARSGRVIGTLLNVLPILGWFVALAAVGRDDLDDNEARFLAVAMLGILLGMFAAQFPRRRRRGPA